MELNYGSGGVKGFLSQDKATFGDGVSDQMVFGEIKEVSGIAFYTSEMCGILGLGYGTISYKGIPTFIESSSLNDKSFSFYLHNNP